MGQDAAGGQRVFGRGEQRRARVVGKSKLQDERGWLVTIATNCAQNTECRGQAGG